MNIVIIHTIFSVRISLHNNWSGHGHNKPQNKWRCNRASILSAIIAAILVPCTLSQLELLIDYGGIYRYGRFSGSMRLVCT